MKCRSNIVFHHLTAFGSGPYEQSPGFARVAEAYAGLTNRTGFKDGPPVQSGYAMLGDGIAGIYGAFALMLALKQRDLTGEPQKIDLGLYEPILGLMEDMIVTYDETGSRMERIGQFQPALVTSRPVSNQGRPVGHPCMFDGKAVAEAPHDDGRRFAQSL